MNARMISLFFMLGMIGTSSASEPRWIAAESRYLHLPVKNGAPVRNLVVSVNGRPMRSFSIELADEKPDWWAFLDISAWKGRNLEISVDGPPESSKGLALIDQGDEIKGAETLYKEALRPQLHFSARRGWLNDPNGLVYANGEYHLFFQHNPYGIKWGNMHWGHAVSPDLLHWKELPEALYPDKFGPMFSGSAVVDKGNTSGLGTGNPLVLAYTAMGNPSVQCLAVGDEKNRVFSKFQENPALKNVTEDNRDPKVFWHEPTRHWVMALYAGVPEAGKPKPVETIQFFTSTNLKEWTFQSRIDGFFECPDFFELAVDGDPSRKKWVLSDASGGYMLGTFDGRAFKPETAKLPGHFGKGFYAAQTFNDLPETDTRRIQIGWGQMESPGMSFNQMMLFPTELALKSTPDGPRLTHKPIREIATLRHATVSAPGSSSDFLLALEGDGLDRATELRVEVADGGPQGVDIDVSGVSIRHDPAASTLQVFGKMVPLPKDGGRLDLTVLIDRTSIEVFAANGLVYVPFPRLATPWPQKVHIHARSGSAKVDRFDFSTLNPVWQTQR